MTVKDLFLSVRFDAIVKALQNTHRNDTSIKSLAGYKEAFDIICNTEFKGEGGEVTFDITPKEKWYEPHNLPLLACYVEGDYWENTVGKTVVKPDNNPFTDAELAGAILWGMTFHGFTRHTQWKLYEESYTIYGRIAKLLERKLYLPYIRDKKVKQDLKNTTELRFGIAFPLEVWNQIDFGRNHQNRAKRKRFYRLSQHINRLKQLDNRLHLIDTITAKNGLHDSELEKRIINAGNILESWRESHTYGQSDRIDYLINLLTNYSPDFNYICNVICNNCKELLIVAYTSNEKPLTHSEEQRLKEIIASTIAERHIKLTFTKGTDSEINEEIALQIIGLSPIPPDDNDDY